VSRGIRLGSPPPSRYNASYLSQLATVVVGQLSQSVDVWCVFDNTASGSAFENARELQTLMV
jgi:uncharacterized protein YecE (DUF72 family)